MSAEEQRLLEMEKKVKLLEEKLLWFSRAVEQSPSTVMITDTKGTIVYVNPKFRSLTGYTAEEVIGKNPRILKSGEQPQAVYRGMYEAVTSGREWRGEFHNRKKNGEYYWEAVSISPLKNSAGKITHFLAVKEDITARKQAEESLERENQFKEALLATIPFGIEIVDMTGKVLFLNDRLRKEFGEGAVGKKCWELYRDNRKMCEGCPLVKGLALGETEANEVEGCFGGRAVKISHTGMMYQGEPAVLEVFEDVTARKRIDRLKDEYVRNVSHELNTPLTIMRQGISQVLDGIVHDQDEVLSIVLDEVDRLTRMINNMLDLSRIEAGKLFLEKSRLDLNDLVAERVGKFKRIAGEKKLSLEKALAHGALDVYADPDKIDEVLINLIGNALKYTPPGGMIRVMTKRQGKTVECSVADTGVGIAPGNLNLIFNKYHQVAAPLDPGAKGIGLGLVIAKELIEMHGGRIWAEGKEGRGSRFTFTLPVVDKDKK